MSWVVIHHCDIIPYHGIEKSGFTSQENAQKYADFKMKFRGVKNVGKDDNDGKCCLYYVEYREDT